MILNSRVLLFSTIIFISVISLLYVQFKAYDTYAHSIKEANEMKQVAKDIRYLDEVLTMSARMAAYTGDTKWISRYDSHVKILDKKIEYVIKDNEVNSLILKVKTANDKLVELELYSFELVKSGKLKQAQKLLDSRDYKENKYKYSHGLNQSIDFITTKAKQALQTQKNNFFMIMYITVILIILLILFNLYIVKVIRKHTNNLEHQKELYSLVSENSPYGILFLDLNSNKIISCNEKAVELLGYKDKKSLLTKVPDDISPKYQADGKLSIDKSQDMIDKAVKNRVNSFEWQHQKANGKLIWLEITLSYINVNSQDMLHVVWKDISDRKDAEEELKGLYKDLEEKVIIKTQENREKDKLLSEQAKMVSMGEMIGNIAHQWRQPLSIISSGATGMKVQKQFGKLDDEIFEKTCDTINDNAQYLSQTIDDFRNFIKNDRQLSTFKIKDTIDRFLNLVQPSFKKHNIELIMDVDESIQIEGYENELIQCLMNIFNNSKDALKDSDIKNRVIFIDVYGDDQVIIKFKDNAGGIKDEILPRIFEPYFTTKHQTHGTGLGLSMTYNLIVEGMKGTIKAKNIECIYKDKTYKGAQFIISLPKI